MAIEFEGDIFDKARICDWPFDTSQPAAEPGRTLPETAASAGEALEILRDLRGAEVTGVRLERHPDGQGPAFFPLVPGIEQPASGGPEA